MNGNQHRLILVVSIAVIVAPIARAQTSPQIVSVESMASHQGVSNDLGIELDLVDGQDNIEPRIQDVGTLGLTYLKVTFDKAMSLDSNGVDVTPCGGLGGATATATIAAGDSTTVLIVYDQSVANSLCYRFNLEGLTAADDGVLGSDGEDSDFWVCYLEADMDQNGFVNLGDRNLVAQPGNLWKPVEEAANSPEVDCNRDGNVNLGDRSVVAYPANLWNYLANSTECVAPCCSAGPARTWHSSIPAGPFSTVTSWSGSLSTTVPIVGFVGRGPSLDIMLFHDSANVYRTNNTGFGVDMGPGWSVSFSGHIEEGIPGLFATVVEDDGSRNVFSNGSGEYVAPPGVYDSLAYDYMSDEWTLTRKDQTKRIFDGDGKLIRIVDSSGNTLTVNWVSGIALTRISDVVDDGGRRIEYKYTSGTDRLDEIYDPANKAASTDFSRAPRSWNIHYFNSNGTDSNGWVLAEVRDPVYDDTAPIVFEYDDDGRITGITDKYVAENRSGKTFGYGYDDDGRINLLSDPSELGNDDQTIAYSVDSGNGDLVTEYYDRRGNKWTYRAFPDSSLKSITDPLTHATSFERDSNFNMTKVIDALSNGWSYSFDDRGNLATATDPLANVTSNSFDDYNNLTSTVDAEGEVWQYFYDDTQDPTLLTSIVEPDDGVNGQGVTELAYYDTNGASEGESNGALAAVIDPNGVITSFQYDQFGHQQFMFEGAELAGGGGTPGTSTFNPGNVAILPRPVVVGTERNDAGNARGSLDSGGFGGQIEFDAIDRHLSTTCNLQLKLPEIAICSPGEAFKFDDSFNIEGSPSPGPPWPDKVSDLTGTASGFFQSGDIAYSPRNQIESLENTLTYPPSSAISRDWSQGFDALGRKVMRNVDSGLGTARQRSQTYSFDDSNGQSTLTLKGDTESAQETYTYSFDDSGRVTNATMADSGGPVSTATYTYFDNNQLATVTYGNGTSSEYAYLGNGWIESITHNAGSAGTKVLLFSYDARGRINAVDERGFAEPFSADTTIYVYDSRGRLIRELRYGTTSSTVAYNVAYTYDNGGNRISKRTRNPGSDDVFVDYHYDTDPDVDGKDVYGTFNNRLMYYMTSNGAEPVETTSHIYGCAGNVSRIITRKENEGPFYGTRLEYDQSGRLWRASGDQWENDWHFFQPENGFPWGFLLTDDEMTLDDARTYAESIGGDLAHAVTPNFLAYIIQEFAPKDGSEVTYWMGGHQSYEVNPGTGTCSSSVADCDADSTWCHWEWDSHDDDLLTNVDGQWGQWGTLVSWIPAEQECPTGSSCYIDTFLENNMFFERFSGGWLTGEPDDNGVSECAEDGEENNMVITFNVNGNVTSHGFADVDSNGMRRALIARKFPSHTSDDAEEDDATYERLWARQFRYDGPRERYLVRELSPATMGSSLEDHWTEYVGDVPLADYSAGSLADTEVKHYNPGVSETDISADETTYIHADQLNSTWFASGSSTVSRRAVRTAFGETVYLDDPLDSRYGYAGGWGYQSHDIDTNGAGNGTPDNTLNAFPSTGFPLMHVGQRYYDPGSGRFVQRNPIGIRGGLNAYSYAGGNPASEVDPIGTINPSSKVIFPSQGESSAFAQLESQLLSSPLSSAASYQAWRGRTYGAHIRRAMYCRTAELRASLSNPVVLRGGTLERTIHSGISRRSTGIPFSEGAD